MSKFYGQDFCFPLGEKTYVMGILNVTDNSFSDGGLYASLESAVAHALRMQNDGADIIDIGACSTAPGRPPVSAREEMSRLMPVLNALVGKLAIPVSVDTQNPETAEAGIQNGAAIINDVSGVLNPVMAGVIRKYNAGWIITCGGSADADRDGAVPVLTRIRRFFEEAADFADSQGISPESVCLDPGIGFGKSRSEDLTVLRGTAFCKRSAGNRALLVGASRKRVVGEASGEAAPQKRDSGTAAAHTIAIAGGADMIRVHDVYGAVAAAKTADAIVRAADTVPTVQLALPPDKIIIRDLRVFAYHGVNAEEKENGQFFSLDIDIIAKNSRAFISDQIGDTVSYASIIKSVITGMTERSFDLIERAAQHVADGLFQKYPDIRELRILLKKPDAPIKADFGLVGIEINRVRL
ncbi:MAG: dihydropteroate synthase [Oscillospiraceae bacterium]|nr:dihydropteroate synthase [Oscillospiraceae bacterium]